MDLSNLLSNLASAAPFMIVDLIAIIMGIVHLSRYKTPAVMALLGGLLNLLTTIAWNAVFYLLLSGDRMGDDRGGRAMWMGVLGITSSVVHALAWGMIVIAVFVGRKQGRRDDEDDDRPGRDRRDRRDDRRDDPPTARASRPRS